MKENYEMRVFTKHFAMLGLTALVMVWVLSWYFCEFEVGKAFLITGVVALFLLGIYGLTAYALVSTYKDVNRVSALMLDVLEGREDDTAEVYKQGSMGLLYTNFYKLVTALRESQMKAGEEKEFLKETMSDISHQLKTPLASLNVFVDLLYEDKVTEEAKRKEILREAGKQLSRMEWLVLAMLKLARIEAGSVQFEKRMCDGEGIIQTAIEAVDYLYQKRRQKVLVVYDTTKEGTQLLCDGEWLTEAIINLLKNASDYAKEGTTVTVTLETHQLFTKLHVQDEGVGIPEEALPHIFKRFYRVDNTVNPGSVGIGLALSKSIVEGMNGKIIVKSEVGKGTCFTITFLK